MKIFDKTIHQTHFERQMLSRDGYDNCTFVNCTFSKADFAEVNFMECRFQACDFSMAQMDNAGLKDVVFEGCNFLGVDLSVCSPFLFKAKFEDCQMDLTIFNGMNLKGIEFINCSLKESDFTEANLTNASFDACNLERAIFQNTNLEKTDFRTSINYTFDPARNILKKTQFSSSGVRGLLAPFDIIITDG